MSRDAEFSHLDPMQPLLPSDFHAINLESKSNIVNREDQNILLRKNHTEILGCINLIKGGIRKRNLPFQIPMLSIMMEQEYT